MTPQELRDQFTLSENETCFAWNGIAVMPTLQYVSWLEQKVIESELKVKEAFEAAREEKKLVVDGIGHFMARKYTDYNEYKRQNP